MLLALVTLLLDLLGMLKNQYYEGNKTYIKLKCYPIFNICILEVIE